MHKLVDGRMGRVVLAQFDKDEDLMEGILHVLREKKMRTGYIATITGAMHSARIQKYPAVTNDDENLRTVTVDVKGPIEASGHGLFGIVEAPQHGDRPFGRSSLVHGEPYVHVHLTVSNAEETLQGHLMMGGNLVKSVHPVSHFTVFIVEVVGAELQIRCDPHDANLSYHFLTQEVGGGAIGKVAHQAAQAVRARTARLARLLTPRRTDNALGRELHDIQAAGGPF